MAVFKCKMCGGTIELEPGASVGVCDSCGSKQTLPKVDDDTLANLFNRANNLRLKCEFDKAEQIYEKIVQQNDSLAEAHWGIVLCKYGIEYVEDPKTGKRVPTCHRTLFDAVTADADYLAAVDYSDTLQQTIYESEARAIDKIQKSILEIVRNEKPFDVFICYKEADESGKRTVDSVIANDIYYQLTQEGFKVFYAAITLEDKLGQEYEPYIFAALNSAKVMLAIGTKPEYFNAVWVKNEWSRFMKLMKTDRSKLLIPCFKDMDAYDLPEEFAHLQAQDMGKIGFINDVVRGIKKVLDMEKKPEPQVVKETVIRETASAPTAPASIAPLLKRAFMFLEDGDWRSANEYCEKVLDQDPENAQAYLGKLMARLQVKKKEQLKNCAQPFDGDNNYQKACRFDASLKKELSGYIAFINDRNETARQTEIYNAALRMMSDAKTEQAYKDAAMKFDSVYSFKDASAQIVNCRQKIADIRAKEEADRKEAERKAEEKRIAEEKAAKKRKKTTGVLLAILALCLAGYFAAVKVIIPGHKYSEAVSLMNSGKYEQAISAFRELNGYKDSESQITACQTAIKNIAYEKAVSLMDSGKYEQAISAFEELNGYKDSEEKAKQLYEKYSAEKLKKAAVGESLFFGAYEQDNNTSNGKEAIEWLVLAKENNRALLLSRYALDCKQYNTEWVDITWETCTLRSWLNKDFLNEAFSAEEQKLIETTNVSADKNPNYSTNPGNATKDKIFILSIAEATKYFKDDASRMCAPTKYAKAQGAYTNGQYKVGGEATCWWWLRSPGIYQSLASDVNSGGSVYYCGTYVYGTTDGVRPALWVNLPS